MNQKSTLISIIVPIYNVEDYLSKCLDSLASLNPIETSQYTMLNMNEKRNNNIEIILIDDGSTDSSGLIADEYTERNSNFFVYHTENHGLSAARNYGIERSCGEWLMFVDSDDYVDPSFCSIPYQTVIKYNAELVVFDKYEIRKDSTLDWCKELKPLGQISREQAVEYGDNTIWNKLYKRELFNEIKFPEGHVYEDLATTYKIIYKAKNIVMIDNRLIYHYYRDDSISHTFSISNIQDYFDASVQRYNFLRKHDYPEEKNIFDYQFAAYLYCHFIDPSNEERYKLAEKILDTYKTIPKKYPIKVRCMLIVWKINKHLFHFICRIFGKKVSKNEQN